MTNQRIDVNPPAFPLARPDSFQFASDGMSLRDWFAGQVLPECASRSWAYGLSDTQVGSPMHPRLAAEAAYKYADAMLAQRNALTGGQDA